MRQFAQRAHAIRFSCLTYAGSREHARRGHWEMIAAIEKRDRQSLVRLCHQHLLASRLCYEKAARIHLRSGMESAMDAGQERRDQVAGPA